MKKFLILVTLIVSAFTFFSCNKDGEEDNSEIQGEEADSSISFAFEGEKIAVTSTPIIQGDEILVSIADASNILGIELAYAGDTGLIKAKNDHHSIEMIVGWDGAIIDGGGCETLEVYPIVVDDTVFVPLIFCVENLGLKISVSENTVAIRNKIIAYDVPSCEQHEWVIKRAHQLSGFKFTPLKDIPSHNSSGHTVLKEGKEYEGILYSSTESNNKFITENVSFETFLSALANPDSVLYTKDLYGSSNASSYYGMVCNTFVRYCLGITPRCNTKSWFAIPGMTAVKSAGEYKIDEIQLCDVLHFYSSGGHVAIITGILRDEDGKVMRIEVSECVKTNCKSRWFSAGEFEAYRNKYTLCRYENIEDIPPFDEEQNDILYNSGIEKAAPMIAVDYGNKSNYFYGETTVISSFREGENIVEIYLGDELIEEISVSGYTKLERALERGYYTVKLRGTEYYTEFCVVKPEITHTVDEGVITITVDSGDPESEISHMEFRGNMVMAQTLTDEEKASGVIVREIPAGETYFKVSFRNEYGIWTHKSIKIYQE